jgi:hypothetical protein
MTRALNWMLSNSMSVQEQRKQGHSTAHAEERFDLPLRILQVERDQKADGARIDYAITQAERDIAALRQRRLSHQELQRSINAVRDRIILTVRDVRRNMATRTIAAKNMEQIVEDRLLRQDFRFAADDLTDTKLRARFFELLARTPTYSLVQHLKDAIDAGNWACAENIRFEFQCREDRHRHCATFQTVLDEHALHDPVEMRKRLGNIRKVADEADARITELLRRCTVIE